MTYRRVRSRALWGCALLMGLLLAPPAPARAEPETKAEAQGLDKAIGRVKQAIGEAEENGKIAAPVEKALEHLLQALEQEHEYRRHRRHNPDEGTFGAGFEQAGDPSTANDGSSGNSDPAGDSAAGSTGSGAGSSLTDSPFVGAAGNSPSSTQSSTSSKGNNSPNKHSPGQESSRGGHSSFAQGLRHAEREERERREERRERRLEHAFARGLIALRSAEEHSESTKLKPAASANGPTGGKAGNGTKTASGTPRPGSSQTAAASPKTGERHEQPRRPADPMHFPPTEAPRIMVAAARSHTDGVVGHHPSTAPAPTHHPTGSAGHASPSQHAGALAGTKHPPHKK